MPSKSLVQFPPCNVRTDMPKHAGVFLNLLADDTLKHMNFFFFILSCFSAHDRTYLNIVRHIAPPPSQLLLYVAGIAQYCN
jgi:hypothetical protein